VNPNGQVIESFEFRGAKRVPQDTLKALIISKPGDIYNEETLGRDFMILWNTSRFDDIRLETEPGRNGLIVRFVVTDAASSAQLNIPEPRRHRFEILTASRNAKSASVWNRSTIPTRSASLRRLKEFLAERGRQYATVEPQIGRYSALLPQISFMVNEGPKVKVGTIDITGNTEKDDRWVIRNMKNLKGIGVPTDLFERLFQPPSTRQARRRQGAHPSGLSRCRLLHGQDPGRDGGYSAPRRKGLEAATR
jgi:outer membrane protein insertion porin family